MVDLTTAVDVMIALEAINVTAWVLAWRQSRKTTRNIAAWVERIFGVDPTAPLPSAPPRGAYAVPTDTEISRWAVAHGSGAGGSAPTTPRLKTFTTKEGRVVSMAQGPDGKWKFTKNAGPAVPPQPSAVDTEGVIQAIAERTGRSSDDIREQGRALGLLPANGGVGQSDDPVWDLLQSGLQGGLTKEQAIPLAFQALARERRLKASGGGAPSLGDSGDWQ
jgi:hypothetical protein